ncbi:butyrophilin subfamily 3 member A2-like [Oreochromis aureus]|uniref:Ig-like domain-containing protein n=1 Tax=Oreochromis aureus TaxID=47969 RepID=A0A668VDF3_OREAU|nr:butyrophilin subfamily 3 member A2-like [Oreochromis aureus]
MFRLKDGRCCKMPLGTICVFLFHHSIFFFHLAHFCGGVSQVVGPSDPVVAIVGDDTVLPCHLDPAVNAADMTVEWTRSDLTPRFVHVWRDGVELVNKKNEAYMERTSLPINNLKLGDISLKLSKVKLSDRGSYKCFSPALSGQASVELVVGVVSSLIITVMGNSEDSSKVVLQCESAGWYPEPELLWLDGEGNLLSAGPTETLRGPDDLYTVSSRVTVEKRHSNNITCRVQQRNTNQSRETHIHVPGDLFNSSCSSAGHIAISVVVIVLLILAVVFVVWKYRSKCQDRNTRTDQVFTEERTETHHLTKDVDTVDFNIDQENINARIKKEEKDKTELIVVVQFLMAHKYDLDNDIHELKKTLRDLQKQQNENQSRLVKNNKKPADQESLKFDKINEEETTNFKTMKKNIEKEIDEKETQINSVSYVVDVIAKKKNELEDTIKKTQTQRENSEA